MAVRRLTDHGGIGRKARVISVPSERVMSMRCNSCNKLTYVTIMQTTRAATPRCAECGGTLVELESSFKKRTGKTFRQAAKAKASIGVKPYSCPKCKKPFRSEVAMHLHFQERHGG